MNSLYTVLVILIAAVSIIISLVVKLRKPGKKATVEKKGPFVASGSYQHSLQDHEDDPYDFLSVNSDQFCKEDTRRGSRDSTGRVLNIESDINESLSDKISKIPKTNIDSNQSEAYNHGNSLEEIIDDFDLRKAFIYESIINPKY